MTDVIGRLAVVTSVDNTELKRGFGDSVKMANDFYRQLHGRTGTPTAAEGSLKRITNDLRQADAHAKSFGFSMRNAIVGGLVSGGTAAAAMIGGEMLSSLGGSIGDIVKDSVQLAANMEVSALSLEGLAGSAEKARDLMKELRQYAKESPLSFRQSSGLAEGLLANGIAAAQVLPTIKVLSDISRGDPLKMSRLQLAYVQSRAKGHLAGQELNQFAETGVPIEEQLAKNLGKSKGEIRGLVEEGRVGFSDVQRALRDMTEEGGAFYKQTERYANSTAGNFDALKDSVEQAKAAFGTVIIEEFGLKEMMKDAGAFTDRLREAADEARPAVRFVGDMVKAGAQLAYLGGRLTAVMGNTAIVSLMDRFPVVRDTVQMIQQGLKDIESMRFDDAQVRDFGVALFGKLSDAFASIFEDERIKKFYTEFKAEVTDPLKDAFKEFKKGMNTYHSAKATGEYFGDALTDQKKFAEAVGWGLRDKKGRDEIDALKRIKEEMADPLKMANSAAQGSMLPTDDPVGAINKNRAYLDKKAADDQAEAYKRALRKTFSPIIGGWALSDPVAPAADRAGQNLDTPMPVKIVGTDPIRGALFGGLGTDALARDLAQAKQRKFEIEQGRNDQLMNKYKPESQKFSDSVAELRKSLADKAIDERVYTLALGDLVRGATNSMGIGKLPQGIEYGSQELAASLAKATAGTAMMSMEQILTVMKDTEKLHYESSLRIEAALGQKKEPPVVPMPQK